PRQPSPQTMPGLFYLKHSTALLPGLQLHHDKRADSFQPAGLVVLLGRPPITLNRWAPNAPPRRNGRRNGSDNLSAVPHHTLAPPRRGLFVFWRGWGPGRSWVLEAFDRDPASGPWGTRGAIRPDAPAPCRHRTRKSIVRVTHAAECPTGGIDLGLADG